MSSSCCSLSVESCKSTESDAAPDSNTTTPQLFGLPSEASSRILSFVSLKDKCSVALADRAARAAVRLSCQYHPELTDGRMPESLARPVCFILDTLRFAVYAMSLVTVSPATRALVKGVDDMRAMQGARDTMGDLMVLNAIMYSQYYQDSYSEGGTYKYLQEVARLNSKSLSDVYPPKVVEDARSWAKTRLFGCFYVLKETTDGAVLINAETLKVYIVTGLAERISERGGGMTLPCIIRTTLLQVAGRYISYDGLSMVMPLRHPKHHKSIRRSLQKVYMDAVDTGSIHVCNVHVPVKESGVGHTTVMDSLLPAASSAKLDRDAPKEPVSPVDKKCADLAHWRSKYAGLLDRLTKASKREPPEGMWTFRRYGYTEKANPNHAVTCILANCTALGAEMLPALLPTVEDMLGLMEKFCFNNRGGVMPWPSNTAPVHVSVDSAEIFEEFKALLEPTGIIVDFYPPPGPEEEVLYLPPEIPAPVARFCAVCLTSSAGDTPMSRCSRCSQTYYCSRDHQREDWSQHRQQCNNE